MVLVTGATGLLGSHVVAEFLAAGYPVLAGFKTEANKAKTVATIRYYYPEQCEELLKKLTWQPLDILDLVEVEDAMRVVTEVVHCAALVSFHRSAFQELFEINRTGTGNLVNAALEFRCRKFVHVSSTAAVGSEKAVGNSSEFVDETNRWSPNERASGYSVSKYSAEKEVWRGIEEGLNAVIVNPSLMVGAGNWDDSSLKMLRTASSGFAYFTEGANAFVDARDVALAIRLLLESEISRERFLITGQNATFQDFFAEVARQTDALPPRKKAGKLATGIAWRLSALRKLVTGKKPSITKETAASAHRITRYSTAKFQKAFPDFRFRSISEMVENAVKGKQP